MKMKINYRPDIYFVSDTHFGHRAMVDYWRKHPTGRRFLDTDEMDEHLIMEWNNVVRTTGTVFHIGDVSFTNRKHTLEILGELNGEIHLIAGNHDQRLDTDRFSTVCDYMDLGIKYEGQMHAQYAVLCHYAMRSWNRMHYGAWNLHGHSHGNLPPQGKQLDVGVDETRVTKEYRPLSIDEVTAYLNTQEQKYVDHHEPKPS